MTIRIALGSRKLYKQFPPKQTEVERQRGFTEKLHNHPWVGAFQPSLTRLNSTHTGNKKKNYIFIRQSCCSSRYTTGTLVNENAVGSGIK